MTSVCFKIQRWGCILPLFFCSAACHAAGPKIRTVFERGDEFGYRIPSVVVSKEGTVLAFAERRVGLHDHAQAMTKARPGRFRGCSNRKATPIRV